MWVLALVLGVVSLALGIALMATRGDLLWSRELNRKVNDHNGILLKKQSDLEEINASLREQVRVLRIDRDDLKAKWEALTSYADELRDIERDD